ncbi:MAG: OmpA family protein [Alphaproteobacteria bacterium]|nr:OmpA family protein [Alphaproteobacteria bacterium]
MSASLCIALAACAGKPAVVQQDDMTVFFGSRSAALVSSERAKLQRLADALSHEEAVTVTLAGFAGTADDSARRMDLLALERTIAVRDALVADLRKANASRIRLGYTSCGIGSGTAPPHRVDIFVSTAETGTRNPCGGRGQPGSDTIRTSAI